MHLLSFVVKISEMNFRDGDHLVFNHLFFKNYFVYIPFLQGLKIHRPSVKICKLIDQFGRDSLVHHGIVQGTADDASHFSLTRYGRLFCPVEGSRIQVEDYKLSGIGLVNKKLGLGGVGWSDHRKFFVRGNSAHIKHFRRFFCQFINDLVGNIEGSE